MYPAISDFSTSTFGDAWYYKHVVDDDGRPHHEDVCHTSGAQFLGPVRGRVRMDMIYKMTSDPYVIGGVRYATLDLIDRDFRFGSAWTTTILEGYNEYLNRRGRPSVSNPLVQRPATRRYFDTSAVTEDLIRKLITGTIARGPSWDGRLGDGVASLEGGHGVSIPPGAIMPRLGASLGDIPPSPVTRCIHRSEIDATYQEPPRPETGGGMGALGYVLIGAGAFLLATEIVGRE